MKKIRLLAKRGLLAITIASLPALGGCSAEKARLLANATAQFAADAQAAIAAVQHMYDAELEPAPRSPSQRLEEFSSNILAVSTDTPLTGDIIDMAIDPYSVQLEPQQVASRKRLYDGLQSHFVEFGQMFTDLERGSWLAKNAVSRAQDLAVKLVVEMSSLSDNIQAAPPRLQQQRTAIQSRIDKVRKDASLSADQKRQQLSDLMSQWETVKANEQQLMLDAAAKCAKAAATGQQVLTLINSYDRLSVDELSGAVNRLIGAGEAATGRDFSHLKAENARVLTFLTTNPEYKAAAEAAIAQAQQELGRTARK